MITTMMLMPARAEVSLAETAQEINEAHGRFEAAIGKALRHARDAGDLLLRVKARLPHSEWTPWVAEHCVFSGRTARRYMRVAKGWPEIEAQNGHAWPLRQALRLLRGPSKRRQPRNEVVHGETALIASLKPHPRNYRDHPPDQIAHLVTSIEENGFYRPVVVARDRTILAGHGAVQAASSLGMERVPITVMPFDADDPRALKMLTGDNAISSLAMSDERALTEMLRELKEVEVGLEGTGYDDMSLTARVFMTRPRGEMESFDAAAEWAGMDLMDYDVAAPAHDLTVRFAGEAERAEFVERNEVEIARRTVRGGRSAMGSIWSGRWPKPEGGRDDLTSIAWDVPGDAAARREPRAV